MDVIEFRRRRPYPSYMVDIVVNERELSKLIGEIEIRSEVGRKPSIVGYMGLVLEALDGSPRHHFLGSANSHLDCGPAEKTVLLSCICGEVGCAAIMARIEVRADTVVWKDFEQPNREADRRYDGLRLTFDRRQYEAALADVER